MENELKHFGVFGQRKGIRRWQYKDGSLTPEGRIHYGYGKESDSNKSEMTEDEKTARKQAILDTRDPAKILANTSLFTDQELAAAYNRLNTERNVRNLIPKEEKTVSRGKKILEASLSTAKTFNDIADTGIKTWNNIVVLHNFANPDKKWSKINTGDNKKKDNDK